MKQVQARRVKIQQHFFKLSIWRWEQSILYRVLFYLPPFLKTMRRQLTQQSFGRVYRQFSRQRYNKYKHQFPRMRESDIVQKIIKEWDSLDNQQKQEIALRYKERKYIRDQSVKSNSNSSLKHQTPPKMERHILPTTEKTKMNRSQDKLGPIYREEEDSVQFNRFSQKLSGQNRSDRSSLSVLVVSDSHQSQIKPGQSKNHNYIYFFKQHYSKLSREHPKWGNTRVIKIIKLLWMKRLRHLKKPKYHLSKKINKDYQLRPKPKLTGLRYYHKMRIREGISIKDIDHSWKRLPLETRKIWDKMGKGEMHTQKTMPTTVAVFRSQPLEAHAQNNFGYIHKTMIS